MSIIFHVAMATKNFMLVLPKLTWLWIFSNFLHQIPEIINFWILVWFSINFRYLSIFYKENSKIQDGGWNDVVWRHRTSSPTDMVSFCRVGLCNQCEFISPHLYRTVTQGGLSSPNCTSVVKARDIRPDDCCVTRSAVSVFGLGDETIDRYFTVRVEILKPRHDSVVSGTLSSLIMIYFV